MRENIENESMSMASAAAARWEWVRPQLAAPLVLTGFAAAVVAVSFAVRNREWSGIAAVLLPVAWLVAAALAVRARPDHPGALYFVGLGTGHLVGFALAVPLAADQALLGWGPWWINLGSTLSYGLGFASLGAFLATYPTGVARSRLERWFVRGVFPLVAALSVVAVVTSSRIPLMADGARSALPAPAGLPLVDLGVPFGALVSLVAVAGAALLGVRARGAREDERRQLSWAIGAAGLLALLLLASPAASRRPPAALQPAVFVIVVAVIPFVLLAGLVRYRLMDVDVYVARTLARGAVVVLVLSAYAVLAGRTGGGGAAAGLAVVAALTGVPLVRRLEKVADRLLNGGRVRGEALIRQLAESLAVPSRTEQAQLTVDTVRTSLDVSWVRLVADDLSVHAGRPVADAELVAPLLAGDLEVGRIHCGPRHGGWGATEAAEIRLLARHAGLALHNAALTARLERQVGELRASRRRIVRAEIDVRRRLERDLHDGIQQQVVAMIVHLGALQVLLPPDSPGATAVQHALAQGRLCLSDLREVVQGVHPPVLLDQGLVAAVESRAGLLPLPVTVEAADRARRYPAETEAAAYYVVSEALTNVVKHARAEHAAVGFDCDGETLTVVVTDDGIGLPQLPPTSGWPPSVTGSTRSEAASMSAPGPAPR